MKKPIPPITMTAPSTIATAADPLRLLLPEVAAVLVVGAATTGAVLVLVAVVLPCGSPGESGLVALVWA
jgi:hypothetical protein